MIEPFWTKVAEAYEYVSLHREKTNISETAGTVDVELNGKAARLYWDQFHNGVRMLIFEVPVEPPTLVAP